MGFTKYLIAAGVFFQALAVDAHQHLRTKEYDLTVTWEEHAPDGFSRQMMLVNGLTPGPVLDIDQDDWVIVRIHNQSPFNATVHFHGVEMKDTPWSDGVPGVTQQPILPGNSFQHEFAATQYGSYWYHSHFLGQIEDGLYGPIVIHPRADDPKPFQSISINGADLHAMEEAEKNVIPFVISDFTHLTSEEKWSMTTAAGFEDSCYDSILFNGKGRVYCLPEKELEENLSAVQKQYLSLVKGSKVTDKGCLPASVIIAFGGGQGDQNALLPGVFSGCKETDGPIEVVTGHNGACSPNTWIALDIVGAINYITGVFSIDDHDMWVYAMDGAYIEPQKVQAIQVTNGDRYSVFVKTHKAGDFKMRFNANSAPQLITGHAILRVGDGSSGAESKPYISLIGDPLSKDVVLFDQAKAHPYPPDAPAKTADALYKLDMKVDGASYLWALNTSRLMPMDIDMTTPILFHPDANVENNVTITTKYGEWIDLVFFASEFPLPPHPIHKHGVKMYGIGSGNGPWKWDSVEDAMKDIPDQFNLVNPPRRDAFASLPAITEVSWFAVRYHVTNPGAWLLHCHINNHLVGGMMMVIQDGIDKWPKIPEYYLDYI